MHNNFVKDLDTILKMDDKEFFSNFAFIMQNALVKDLPLYTDLIDSMYEICEREENVLSNILERCEKNICIVHNKYSEEDVLYPFNFGMAFAKGLSKAIPGMNAGEYLSLGCVAQGYISYQKNWLTKEEYYEIRDMFVPFYLPISVEMLDIEKSLNILLEDLSINDNGYYSLVLLKKIGKTVSDNTITKEDLRKAFEELNFDEAW